MTDHNVANESAVTISLGDGATYDIYHDLFLFLAGKADWQKRHTPIPEGWNVELNGDDVNVTDVDDEGIHVRPPLDDTWQTFGDSRFVPWDDVHTIVIF